MMTDLFTVTTWNVLYRDLDRRLTLQAERLNAIRPDVLLLQETNPVHARVLAEHIGMTIAAIPPESETPPSSLSAVLVREPAIAAGVRALTAQPTGGYRHFVFADVRLGNRIVRCSTSHLQHTHRAGQMGVDEGFAAASRGAIAPARITNQEVRVSVERRLNELSLIAQVRAELPPRPEIFGGDLNFIPRGPEYQRILSWELVDSWAAGPRLGNGATILGANPLVSDGAHAYDEEIAELFPGHVGTIDYTLDYLFHSRELTARRAWVFGGGLGADDWPSDHLGLTVQYELCERDDIDDE